MRNLLFLAVTLTLAACVDDPAVPSPVAPAVQGSWRISEQLSSATRQTSCANTSIAMLTGDESAFSGNYWQSGYCRDQYASFDNSAEGVMRGRIMGDVITWDDAGCTYTGSLARRYMRGTVSCRIQEDGETYLFTGTWEAIR